MPSDDRVTTILEALAVQRDQFRSAVAEASEQLRAALSGYRSETLDEAERAAVELGRFARGRIDPALFALVFANEKAVDPTAIEWIDRAEATLQEVVSTTHLMQHVNVEPGASLYTAVDRALGRVGRVFGAVRIAELARAGHPIRDEAGYLEQFAFAHWSRAERRITLPLVVQVKGADLNVAGLEEFLDGNQIIVLLVDGDAPPAALVRLITPSVFVAQSITADEAVTVGVAGGPAILAVVPESSAQFVYDRTKLTIGQLPPEARLVTRGRMGAFQQREELLQLERLSALQAAPSPAEPPAAAEPQPDDVLAGWLLRQADLVQA